MCQSEFSSCPSKSKNRHESNNYINNNIHNEKETWNKTELKETPQKNRKEKPVFILGDSIPKYVNGYEITKKIGQLQSIYEEPFWSKNKMYWELCATLHQDQSRPYSYPLWLY